MTGGKIKRTTFKRIQDKKVSLWHFIADVIALTICHSIFLYKYQLPYFDIFSPLLPLILQPYCVTIIISNVILVWLFAFYVSGHYSNTARKSGLQVIGPTAATCFIMSILLFFILDNYTPIVIQVNTIELSIKYLFFTFLFTFTFRMILILRLHYLISNGKRGYKKILIGNNNQAFESIAKIKDPETLKNSYIGYLYEEQSGNYDLNEFLPCLGSISQINTLVNKRDVDEAIVYLNQSNHNTINLVISNLKQKEILIRLHTNMNQMLERTVKSQNIESFPFITIGNYKIPAWQLLVKRVFDYSVAWIGFLVTSPLNIGLAIAIKLSSPGPIFYKQERLGKNKKPFMIYKFRSMYVDAEKDGPSLAYENDPRVTKLGKIMRKWRLDELPQFINIILGDMSFVGPRPERQYFIDQILPKAPHYSHLFSVRPGITSWGMVKYGYAENVDEMIERLQYDILYLENRTLVVDFKILLYTIKTLFQGEGK